MAEAASVYPTLDQRPIKNTVCLFDVDGTLTAARRVRALPPEILQQRLYRKLS